MYASGSTLIGNRARNSALAAVRKNAPKIPLKSEWTISQATGAPSPAWTPSILASRRHDYPETRSRMLSG